LMKEQLRAVLGRRKEIVRELASPETQRDPGRLTALMKEEAQLQPVAEACEEYERTETELGDCESLLKEETDAEMIEMLKAEASALREKREALEMRLKRLLLPKDPDDSRNVIMEIRAGAGGDEAALFAADLARMYQRYAEKRGWRTEMLSLSENGLGGIRECTMQIRGQDVFARLRYESGTHRVQRVPETESSGRIHTSTATVAIMPEAEDIDEVEIDPKDIRIDVFRASGNGGQCVNTTDSAVRLTHLPTGIVISCQDEKSQIKNRSKAMKVLRTKLLYLKRMEQAEERADLRRSQVGTGDRSEKIRTYNVPQGRVTDHRIHLTLHRIDSILDGDIDELTDALIEEAQTRRLSGQ